SNATVANANFIEINAPAVGNFYHLPVFPVNLSWGPLPAQNLLMNCTFVTAAPLPPLPVLPAVPTFGNCTKNGGGTFPLIPAGATVITTEALQARDSGTIGGFIKIDMQDAAGAWRDVTMEILNYGIGDRNQAGGACADPSPNAILRIQRLRDNGGTCHYAGSI